MKGYQSLIKILKSSYLTLSKFRIFDFVIIAVLLNLAIIFVIILYIQKIYQIEDKTTPLPYIKIDSLFNAEMDESSVNASASAFVIYDTKSRSVLAGKNHNLRFTPASTIKIMSAVVALSYYDMDSILTVPSDIYSVVGSKMNLYPNEQISVRTLLYGMLLPSGNDAAYTLARNYPGSTMSFVEEMNKKAADLRLDNTYFVDPDGYNDANYTTAVELARLAAHGMSDEKFREIVSTRYIQLSNTDNSHIFELENLNELLKYSNVIGVKTGFTNEAGGVLVTAIEKNDSVLIVVVLKSPDRFSDTQDLMEFINNKIDVYYP